MTENLQSEIEINEERSGRNYNSPKSPKIT